jgi:predicted dehydrogenase
MISIGLVGCGFIGDVHAAALAQLRECALVDGELTATFDIDGDRARRTAERHGATAAPSLEALVETVDAVWVCTWTAAHLEVVETAASAGRAVFCEKPLAPTLADSERVAVALCRVPHQVGLVLRYAPVFTHAAELIASGRFGRPLATVMRDDQYFPIQGLYRSTWRKDAASAGGGTLLEHSIHDVDLLGWLLGEPTSVSARVASMFGHAGIDDVAALTFGYADGSVAQLTSVWHQVLTRTSSRRLEVFCQDGLLWTDDDYLGPLHIETGTAHEVVAGTIPTWAEGFSVPAVYARVVAAYAAPSLAFLRALATGSADAGHPSAPCALTAHRVVDRAYRSAAAEGARVLLGAGD